MREQVPPGAARCCQVLPGGWSGDEIDLNLANISHSPLHLSRPALVYPALLSGSFYGRNSSSICVAAAAQTKPTMQRRNSSTVECLADSCQPIRRNAGRDVCDGTINCCLAGGLFIITCTLIILQKAASDAVRGQLSGPRFH